VCKQIQIYILFGFRVSVDEAEDQGTGVQEYAKVELYVGHFPLHWKTSTIREFVENLIMGEKLEKFKVLTAGRKKNSVAFVTVREELAFKYAFHSFYFI